ncbi:flagellar basal body-associated protein FliL [Nitrosomonas ureae]|uniref:Flagellar protein FliL n=1 Tax=Nitrosomonas ureae TaxID=44577 RepID=A0A0S3AGQ0_9PROT|nr:flagellar basal body-associated protein FliL [Nitrosomonas ureae]ALQ50367.1 flagellar basal body-associated protein FliL [Nitrosomonas ureae]SDT87758.1 flagellar FliL protein [Nitrosomonas ureae]SOD17451.1 flagellar FliL protein [Nitrosomonas ureae]
MSKSNETPPAEGKKSKKGLVIIILIAIIAICAGAGGTWYFMQMSGDGEGETEKAKPKAKPTTFIDLDIFTVNLQPEENNQYLQVGLTVKTRESEVVQEIAKQMPLIRNRILMLLSSKKAADISSIAGKQQLSQQVSDEIRQSIDSEDLQEDVREVLFTSFVIQ